MKTVEEHNQEVTKRTMEWLKVAYKTGVRCPTCYEKDNTEVEMLKDDPYQLMMSNPPQRTIYCPTCGFRTHILA